MAKQKQHNRQMLINYMPGEECRIAIVADGRLEEFYQERASSESHVGNIYKGRVTNVEPSIQAAFVDFGIGRNGFLHVTDLHPMYFPGGDKNTKQPVEQVGSKTPHRERPPIQKALRKGQEVLVQVLKEGIGTKGPTLTSYLSIPGRFLVMMPHMEHHGVSRKVDDEETRKEARRLLDELNPPDDFGFIVRTAGLGQTKTDLKRDLSYLQRLWKTIERRRKQTKGAGELYAESDLIIRTIRDIFSSDIERIVVDDLTAARRARDFLAIANPRAKSKAVYYDDPVPLFHRFDIEQQIENINSHTVPLPSGGSLVIEQTEALVAIDVNSGKSREARDAESNAYNTNLEAVDEICRQLRLRDLGGVIVNDLIDMRHRKNRRQIEQRMRTNLKDDRARTRTGPITQFGILEMTRQRMRPSLKSSIYMDCPNCGAPGHVKTPESVVLDIMRRLQLVMHRKDVTRIELNISPDVAFHLLNYKRSMLVHLEQRFSKSATVRVGSGTLDHVHIQAFDQYGNSLGTDLDITADRMAPETETSYRDLDDPELPPPGEEAKPAFDATGDEADKTELESALEATHEAEQAGDAASEPAGEDEPKPGKRRRRRRSGRGRRKKRDQSSEAEAEAEAGEPPAPAEDGGADEPADQPAEATGAASDNGDAPANGKRRRGRRRGGRRRRRRSSGERSDPPSDAHAETTADDTAPTSEPGHATCASGDEPDDQSGESHAGADQTAEPEGFAEQAGRDQADAGADTAAPYPAKKKSSKKRPRNAGSQKADDTASSDSDDTSSSASKRGKKASKKKTTSKKTASKKTSRKKTTTGGGKRSGKKKKTATTSDTPRTNPASSADETESGQPPNDPAHAPATGEQSAGGEHHATQAADQPSGYTNRLVESPAEASAPAPDQSEPES